MIFLWILGLLGLLGLCVGTFLNVVIDRLPRMYLDDHAENQQHPGDQSSAQIGPEELHSKKLFFSSIRSLSPCCKNKLLWWHLKGRCFFCRAKISREYPLIELLSGVGFMLCFWRFGLTEKSLAAMIFLSFGCCLCMIDLTHLLLPDELTLGLLWMGLLFNLQGLWVALPNAVLGAVLGYLMFWIIFYGFKFLTGKEGLGFGDFKLMAALGAWFGAMALPEILWVSGILGLIFSGIWKFYQRKKFTTLDFFSEFHEQGPVEAQTEGKYEAQIQIAPEFPFGPALVFSGMIELFWGYW